MPASLHRNTPSLTAFDPRGLPVRNVAYHRASAEDAPTPRVRRAVHSANGFVLEQWDPRLQTQPNQRYLYSLSGAVVRRQDVDAGLRLLLAAPSGQVVQAWDGRGAHQRHEYDALLRPVAVFEQAATDAQPRCVERLVYAAPTEGHRALNRNGRLLRHADPAGTQMFDAYGMGGQVLSQTRRFCQLGADVDWPQAAAAQDGLLQNQAYTTRWRFDALGATLEQIDARGNSRQFLYGVDGQLQTSSLSFKDGARKALIERCLYNAAGQLESALLGNGVSRQAHYGVEDGRLQRLTAQRAGDTSALLQDLRYAYDPVGNVVSLLDQAQPTQWHSNTQIEAASHYAYDSLYQLIQATGRESAVASIGPGLPAQVSFGATDSGLWRNYTQRYEYDAAGNLTQLRHAPSTGSGYTRTLQVADDSNRGLRDESSAQGFDANGNQQWLARGQPMHWNVRNQLAKVTLVQREAEPDDEETYVYASDGQRALKLIHRQVAGQRQTARVYYLPGLEVRHSPTRQLNVLRVEAGPCAVEVLQWEQGPEAGAGHEALRFCLTDHQSSHTLELDEQAQLLSQESYFPFGGTAWWASRNALEGHEKSRRYCGKERDASGLYYYGFRYYAPWLQRWINPDPAGAGDGSNPYLMANNNPVTLVDVMGLQPAAAETTRIVGGLIILLLFALMGLSAGTLHGDAASGAAVGALIGGLLFGASRLRGYREMQPQALARADEEAEQQFARSVTELALDLAQQAGLSHQETERLVNFAYERRHGEEGVSIYLSVKEDRVLGYVGPVDRTGRVDTLLTDTRNPGPEMRRMGFSTLVLRGPARALSPTGAAQGGGGTFEVVATTQAASGGRARRGRQSSAAVPGMAPSASSAALPEMRIDSASVADIDPLSRAGRSIALTLSHLRARRFGAIHWHQHDDRLWSADLHGYAATRGRGAYRLMFRHLGGSHYRVEGVRQPHRR